MSAYNFKCSSRFRAFNSGFQARYEHKSEQALLWKGAFVFMRAPGVVVSRWKSQRARWGSGPDHYHCELHFGIKPLAVIVILGIILLDQEYRIREKIVEGDDDGKALQAFSKNSFSSCFKSCVSRVAEIFKKSCVVISGGEDDRLKPHEFFALVQDIQLALFSVRRPVVCFLRKNPSSTIMLKVSRLL